jgi:hypothetical protein
MQIHSLSRALVSVLLLMLLVLYYLYNYVDQKYSVYIFVPAIFGVLLYVFHGPIDHWYREKFPIPFDPKIEAWLVANFPAFSRFDVDQKKLFKDRLSLYTEARLFQSVGSELGEVPDDIQAMVAAHGVHMGLGFKDYLIGDMDRIFLYKHPFPSPMDHRLHSVETHVEDGTIILNTEQLINSIFKPDQFYNIAYHAYAEAMIDIHKMKGLPDNWYKIMLVSGMSEAEITEQVGIPIPNPGVVHVTCYFSFPEQYKIHAPEEYETISRLFRI